MLSELLRWSIKARWRYLFKLCSFNPNRISFSFLQKNIKTSFSFLSLYLVQLNPFIHSFHLQKMCAFVFTHEGRNKRKTKQQNIKKPESQETLQGLNFNTRLSLHSTPPTKDCAGLTHKVQLTKIVSRHTHIATSKKVSHGQLFFLKYRIFHMSIFYSLLKCTSMLWFCRDV